MKLYIDTSDNKQTRVCLGEEELVRPSGPNKSQQVLILIEELLQKKHLDLPRIHEIMVKTGPGSFTGLRVGVAVANTLGWALKIPVNRQKVVEPTYEGDK